MFRSNKLYRVSTIIASVPVDTGWFNDVPIKWYVADRESPVLPYWHAIMDYRVLGIPARARVERALDELFTEEEARQFMEFLDIVKNGNDVVNLEEKILPLHSSELILPADFLPEDDGTSLFHIKAGEEYTLPFQVTGKAELSSIARRNNAFISMETQ